MTRPLTRPMTPDAPPPALAPTPWLTPAEAAAYLGVSVHQLHRWAQRGEGPRRAVPRRRVVRYHREDLDAWMWGTPPAPPDATPIGEALAVVLPLAGGVRRRGGAL